MLWLKQRRVRKAFQVDTWWTLTTNLVSYWKMEDTTDYWGTNNWTNNWVTFTTWKVNNWWNYNWSSNYIVLPNSSDFKITWPFTISMWFKTTSPSDMSLFQSWSQNINNAWIRLWFLSWNFRFETWSNTWWTQWIDWEMTTYSSTWYIDGNWHLIQAIYDWTTLSIYLDNVLKSSTSWTNNPWYATINYVRLWELNNSWAELWYYLNWMQDEIWIWSKVLSSQERTDIWNSGNWQTMI